MNNRLKSESIQSQCTSLSLRRAARTASQFLENYLLPVGLHSSQFGVLNSLSLHGPLTMINLADHMSLDRTTLTRNVQVLQRDGLVQVIQGVDRRVREVALTERGEQVLSEAIPLWQKAEADLAARIGDDQRQALLTIGKQLSQTLADNY